MSHSAGVKSQKSARHRYVFASGPADFEESVVPAGVIVPRTVEMAVAGGVRTQNVGCQAADRGTSKGGTLNQGAVRLSLKVA